MLKYNNNFKKVSSVVFISIILVLGLIGSTWYLGQAETIPTVPTIPVTPTIPFITNIEPSTVIINSDITEFTITGIDFLTIANTMIRWVGPDFQVYDAYPTFVNTEGTSMKVKIPALYLTTEGLVNIWVINHPNNIEWMEISGPYNVNIVDLNFIYLPLVVK